MYIILYIFIYRCVCVLRVMATLNVLEIFGGEIGKDTVMRRDVTIITMETMSVWPDLSTENNEQKLYGKHNKK